MGSLSARNPVLISFRVHFAGCVRNQFGWLGARHATAAAATAAAAHPAHTSFFFSFFPLLFFVFMLHRVFETQCDC